MTVSEAIAILSRLKMWNTDYTKVIPPVDPRFVPKTYIWAPPPINFSTCGYCGTVGKCDAACEGCGATITWEPRT